MNHTFAQHILTQLRSSGFTVEKCHRESQWQLLDKSSDKAEVLMWSKSLGDLARKVGKEFGLSWE